MNINEIKEYNAKVQAAQKKVADINAERNIRTQELNKLCAELTQELGYAVTPENIEQVYQQVSKSIEDTMASGNEILTRVEQEINGGDSVTGVTGVTGVAGVTGVTGTNSVAGVAPANNQANPAVAPMGGGILPGVTPQTGFTSINNDPMFAGL